MVRVRHGIHRPREPKGPGKHGLVVVGTVNPPVGIVQELEKLMVRRTFRGASNLVPTRGSLGGAT